MKIPMRPIIAPGIALGLLVAVPVLAQHSWMAGPFTKVDSVNPCLLPMATSVFTCPVRGAEVTWESKDVFNPAAVVHDGKVFLLYRAQDQKGKSERISRIGLAWSDDGLRSASYFFKPERSYEKTGQVNNVCFLEGMVGFKGQWMLYYGTADSKIAVAVCDEP